MQKYKLTRKNVRSTRKRLYKLNMTNFLNRPMVRDTILNQGKTATDAAAFF